MLTNQGSPMSGRSYAFVSQRRAIHAYDVWCCVCIFHEPMDHLAAGERRSMRRHTHTHTHTHTPTHTHTTDTTDARTHTRLQHKHNIPKTTKKSFSHAFVCSRWEGEERVGRAGFVQFVELLDRSAGRTSDFSPRRHTHT